MRTKNNYRLSRHFTFYEFIEGIAMPAAAINLNWEHIDECDEHELKCIAHGLELVRLAINEQFKSDIDDSKEIGLNINAGWRCKAWELLQKRSGNSYHTVGAADVTPSNVSKSLSDKIIYWLHTKYSPVTIDGWYGGFAIKEPTKDKTGFVHFDFGPVRRWTY